MVIYYYLYNEKNDEMFRDMMKAFNIKNIHLLQLKIKRELYLIN